MAACGSLQHLLEKPLPDNPTLLESLSPWNNNQTINPKNPIEQEEASSFTELFDELHFKESRRLRHHHHISSLSSSQRSRVNSRVTKIVGTALSSSYTLMNWERLQLCTEGLGFESSDDVEKDLDHNWPHLEEGETRTGKVFSDEKNSNSEFKKVPRQGGGTFPPPISCIGKTGKPAVCFKSYRQHGRFVLKQVRIPSQEFLHACREDGRLKLQFVRPEDIEEEDDYGSEEEYLTEDEESEEIDDTNRDVNKCNEVVVL